MQRDVVSYINLQYNSNKMGKQLHDGDKVPKEHVWLIYPIEEILMKRISLATVATIVIALAVNTGCTLHGRQYSELANDALKRSLDLGSLDVASIREMLAAHEYDAIEKLFGELWQQYQKDVNYESRLQKSCDMFTKKNKFNLTDLNQWVNKTESAVAYTARGIYRADQGFEARGYRFINDTPDIQIQSMIAYHNEAVKDLLTAVKLNPNFTPPYGWLIYIAKASSQSFTPLEILQKAEERDTRNYYVRSQYMGSLLPRWGGTHEAMKTFAQRMSKFADLNPRLWSLQGEAFADLGNVYMRDRNYDAAIEAYTKAMQFGERVNWLNNRASCYQKTGRRDKAVQDYKRVLYYDPVDRMAISNLERLEGN